MNIRVFFKNPSYLSKTTRLGSIPCVWFYAIIFVASFGTVLFFNIYSNSAIHTINPTLVAWISMISFLVMITDLSYSINHARLTTVGEQAYVVYRCLYAVALKTLHPHYQKKSLTYAYRDCETYHNGHLNEFEWNLLLYAMSVTTVNNNLDVTQFAKPYNPTLPLTYIYPLREYFFSIINISPEIYIWHRENGLGRQPPESTSQLNDWMDLAASQQQHNTLSSICKPIATECVARTRKM